MNISHLPATEQVAIELATAFALYVPLVGLGRLLKQRAGLHLGMAYRLLALVLAVYIPLELFQAGRELVGLRELRAAAILLGSVFLLAVVRRYLWEGYFEKRRGVVIPKLLRDIVAILVFLIALVGVLTFLYGQGKSLTGVLAGSGIVAIVLGFAMQDTIANLISGISLQISGTFRQGDWLKFENEYAELVEINWRSTRLRTTDNIFVEIPNSHIVKNTIINLSYHTPEYAMSILLAIDYSVPPNTVIEVLEKVAAGVPGVLPTPAPKVLVADFADSAIVYRIKYWLHNYAQYNDICSDIRANAWYELKRHNIKIPFPIRTLQIEPRQAAPVSPLTERQRAGLRNQSFFQCLDQTQFDKVFSRANICWFGKHEVIVRQGDQAHHTHQDASANGPQSNHGCVHAVHGNGGLASNGDHGDSMFIILHGRAGVYVNHSAGQGPALPRDPGDGTGRKVATLGEGEFFGEMSLLTGEPRTATVRAEVDCQLLKINKELLGEILQESPELVQRVGELLAQRKLQTEGIRATLATQHDLQAAQRELQEGFLKKLRKYFAL